jgi:hypothetical protein
MCLVIQFHPQSHQRLTGDVEVEVINSHSVFLRGVIRDPKQQKAERTELITSYACIEAQAERVHPGQSSEKWLRAYDVEQNLLTDLQVDNTSDGHHASRISMRWGKARRLKDSGTMPPLRVFGFR